MKFGAVILVTLLVFSAFAGAQVVVSSLPEPVRPLAEVETNIFFGAGAAADNKWTLTIERDAAASNSIEVVFGCDANEDGILGIEEGELSIGWDCGEWFWRDRRANAACRVAVSGSRMDWRLRLSSTVTSSTEGSDPSVETICFVVHQLLVGAERLFYWRDKCYRERAEQPIAIASVGARRCMHNEEIAFVSFCRQSFVFGIVA